MVQAIKEAYKKGRKAAEFDQDMQNEIRSNIVSRAEEASSEAIEKSKIRGSVLSEKRKELVAGIEAPVLATRLLLR